MPNEENSIEQRLRTAAENVSKAWTDARKLRQEDPTGEAAIVQRAIKQLDHALKTPEPVITREYAIELAQRRGEAWTQAEQRLASAVANMKELCAQLVISLGTSPRSAAHMEWVAARIRALGSSSTPDRPDAVMQAERRVIDTVKCVMQLEAEYRDSPCMPSQAAIDEELEALREAASDLHKAEKIANRARAKTLSSDDALLCGLLAKPATNEQVVLPSRAILAAVRITDDNGNPTPEMFALGNAMLGAAPVAASCDLCGEHGAIGRQYRPTGIPVAVCEHCRAPGQPLMPLATPVTHMEPTPEEERLTLISEVRGLEHHVEALKVWCTRLGFPPPDDLDEILEPTGDPAPVAKSLRKAEQAVLDLASRYHDLRHERLTESVQIEIRDLRLALDQAVVEWRHLRGQIIPHDKKP